MTRDEFEIAVLRLWARSRVPLTRANVQLYTREPRARVEKWLDALVSAGVLELDSDDDGEPTWTVPGAKRAANGPQTVDELERLERLEREVAAAPWSPPSRAVAARAADRGRDRKSLAASGILSFFFGPFGWLYAAPFSEAVPAILAYLLVAALLPQSVLATLLPIAAPLSGLVGMLYAWRYNERGERTSLRAPRAPRALPPGRGARRREE